MINELFDASSKIRHFEVYANSVKINDRLVNDFILSFEVETNYFRYCLPAVLVCNEELFTLSIGKTPSELTDEDTMRFIFSDNNNELFDRRFVIHKTYKHNESTETDSEEWNVILCDVYGYAFLTDNYNKYVTQKGYSGTPLKIVEDAINNLFLYINERAKIYGDKKISIVVKHNEIEYLNDLPHLEYRFTKNEVMGLAIIKHFCKKYNIHIYQDYNNLYIIQNPMVSDLEKPDDFVYRENVGTRNYYHKICDKIKQKATIPTNERPNYRISLNEGGKKQSVQELKFENLLNLIELNKHEKTDFKNSNVIYQSSTETTLSALLYSEYRKYLCANNLIIYTRPVFKFSNVGTITNVSSDYISNNAVRRNEGDSDTSGYYLIRSTTLKIVDHHLIGRVILCRYDNPSDYTSESEVIGESEIKENGKMEIPKSEFKEMNELYDEIETDVEKLKKGIKTKSKEDLKRKKEALLNEKRIKSSN